MGVKIFLIRHGQTSWNEEGRYQGGEDIGLSPAGIRQGRLAARYLGEVNLSNIYSSHLKRAMDTASAIKKDRKLEVRIKEDLREINFGKWEGLKFDEIDKKYHDDYRKWLGDLYNNSPTGGESFKDVQKRAIAEINNIIGENEDKSNVAVATHGGIIISLIAYWLQVPVSRWGSIIQRQGAINIVVIDKDFPYISTINYTGHLAPVYDEREDKVIETYSGLRSKG
ncbi:MAG: alpha-ribazole phosphatase [Actinomycetota bacterium]|nr:alpha-ribazole phosphatase [Actinomycetota bacterium]